jgi:GNAT superfamily N-acetyltransferase
MSELQLTVSDQADDADYAAVTARLSAFNDADVGASGTKPLMVKVCEEGGELAAGIYGYTAWGWLYVQKLWVAEALRGTGWAARMLEAAEHEARRRGCHGAWIDTFNPVALKVYTRAGYRPFGALEDFPFGRTRTFLSKTL